MSLARIFYILGIVMMVWAVISGANFMYQVAEGETTFSSGYTFKIGMFLIGLALVYIGRRSSKKK